MCVDCDKNVKLQWGTDIYACTSCGQIVDSEDITSSIIRRDYAENLYTEENYIGSFAEVIHNRNVIARFDHRNAHIAAEEYAQGVLAGYYK